MSDNLHYVYIQVFVRYTGRLAHNGKVFDSNTGGKGRPFMFRLGQGEVIQGWDEGITGVPLLFQEGWDWETAMETSTVCISSCMCCRVVYDLSVIYCCVVACNLHVTIDTHIFGLNHDSWVHPVT